ncbi:HAMP domain-containing sensor histidine kinase [Actinoplanes sp. NPDC051470]|uniref:sensor histidine kinase n=1 Tax=unclassified Actinoplanes TaxID=2626549 RepID=UPI00342CBBD4
MPARTAPARMSWRHSLFVRLVAISVLISIGSIVAATWLAVGRTTTAIQQAQGRALGDGATIYDSLMYYAATNHTWNGAENLVAELAGRSGRQLTVTDLRRKVLLRSGTGESILPAEPSVRLDPLQTDPTLDPGRSGIDSRAVGPFALTDAEKEVTRKRALDVQACIGARGSDPPPLNNEPNGRVVAAWADPSPFQADLASRCRADDNSIPVTPTETKALEALQTMVNRCLGEHGVTETVRVYLDFTWEAGDRRSSVDGAAQTCVALARREQLRPYVAPPALLFVTDPDGHSTSSFRLSRGNVERIAEVTAAVLAVSIAVTMLLAARLVRPLRALTAAASSPNGDAPAVAVRRKDEIGILAGAFNELSQRRRRADEQRQAVVRDVAHELRTPVTNIRGWLEAIEDGLANPLSDPALASALLNETRQLQHIIEDLRDLAAGDAGELMLRPEPVPVAALLDQVVTAHEGIAGAAGVTLRVRVVGSPLLPVDPVRLRQALGNLLSNALRHTPAGGIVTLRGAVTGDWLSLEVADTGTGIAADDLPHVFDRFWRADSSRSRDTGGSGLGLAIVQQIARLHGGQVSVTSTPGQGSRFVLSLPYPPAAARDVEGGR